MLYCKEPQKYVLYFVSSVATPFLLTEEEKNRNKNLEIIKEKVESIQFTPD